MCTRDKVTTFSLFITASNTTNPAVTYINDEEVEPAPVVGEVLLEAVGEPLEHHLQDEDVGEDLVGILQHHLDHPPLLDVDVLKGLDRGGDGFDLTVSLSPIQKQAHMDEQFNLSEEHIITNSSHVI